MTAGGGSDETREQHTTHGRSIVGAAPIVNAATERRAAML
jgi:hypothetical protein